MALSIEVADETLARAICRELLGLCVVDLHAIDTGWEIRLESSAPLNLVLGAVREALRGRPTESVKVTLDGRVHVLEGEA